MKTLEKLNAAIEALHAGQQLGNPVTWKTTQAVMGPILVILGVVAQFADFPLTGGQLNAISFGIATVGVLVNSYLTVATTATIGVKPK
jgi:hypothetical protein